MRIGFILRLNVAVIVLFSAAFNAYKKLTGSEIEDSVEGETTGNLENLLLAVGKCDLSEWHLSDPKQKEGKNECFPPC